MKHCSHCGETDPTKFSGKDNYCRVCRREYMRKYMKDLYWIKKRRLERERNIHAGSKPS